MTTKWAAAAAIVYAVTAAGVIAFELALALGAPWGAFAMGGAFPGQYPPAMRAAAVVQALIIAALASIVLSRAGLALPRWSPLSRKLIWLVVALMCVGVILNLITPSAGERAIWAPVALVQLLSSLAVALGVLPSRILPPTR